MTLYIFSIFILVILIAFLMLRVGTKSIDYLAFATNRSISVIIPKGAVSKWISQNLLRLKYKDKGNVKNRIDVYSS